MGMKLQLLPNEVKLMEASNVQYKHIGWTDDLVLTNLNIYVVEKGVFGNTKNIVTLPLNQIKMYNGKPVASVTRDKSSLTTALNVSFMSEEAKFTFQSYTKTTGNKWLEAIYSVLAPSVKFEETGNETSILRGIAGGLGKGLKDITRGVLESSGASKYVDRALEKTLGKTDEIEAVTVKCAGCGATLTGNKGETVACPYCDNKQVL